MSDDGSETTAGPGAVSARLRDPVVLSIAGVAAVALLARLYDLGSRIVHWDEGRVAYWALRYHETGQFEYRPIVHGPFLQIVNDWIFAVLGPTDFSARLVVAVAGGLLPLAALLFRSRLRDDETVALAVVLAANPLLLYYSRFMRNDVLVGGFALVALGLAVYGFDRDVPAAFPLAGVSMALAFATKENALVYAVCFLGAGAILLDHRLVRGTARGGGFRTAVVDLVATLLARLRAWGGSLPRGVAALAVVAGCTAAAFVGVVAFFYAPRPELSVVLSDPARLPSFAGPALVEPAEKFTSTWVGGAHQRHPYLPFLYDYIETLTFGAPAVLGFAALGFVVDGYVERRRRALVAFAAYWGAVSVVGYPAGSDIQAPWAAVHTVVPLAIPAAVGVAYAARSAAAGLGTGDRAPNRAAAGAVRPASLGPAVAALLLLVAGAGVVGANVEYLNSTQRADDAVLQYAQPSNELKPAVLRAEAAIRATNDGPDPDVLYYGTEGPGGKTLLYVENESSAAQPRVGGPNWHSRLPLPWYFERAGAEVTSTAPGESLPADPPPVVVAHSWDRAALAAELDGYTAAEHRFRLWGTDIVIFVDRDALPADRRL